jgi:membrane dipeptidase
MEKWKKRSNLKDIFNKNPGLTRAEFLKWIGVSSIGFFSVLKGELTGGPLKIPQRQYGDVIERLFRESLIIDGTVNLGLKRGREHFSFLPGEIKKMTGINIGGHTTRVAALKSRNQWLAERNQGLIRIDRAGDMKIAQETNRYGIIYYVQSGFELRGSLEPLAEWKEGGLRIFQLTYRDNELGGGAGSDGLPLTPFGKKVVQELNKLRMVVDVSHCAKRTTLDAADASSFPITANHANVEALAPVIRNKSDEELKAIAETGGVIGITTVNRFLMSKHKKPATIDDFVAHIDYLVEKIGIDHVGVGSDSYMDGTQRYDVDFSDEYINSPERWKNAAQRLNEKGYQISDLRKIFGLNFKRVYNRVLDP